VDHADFMRLAIDQGRRGLAAGQSPFGAVIVRGDRVVAAGHNEVPPRTPKSSRSSAPPPP